MKERKYVRMEEGNENIFNKRPRPSKFKDRQNSLTITYTVTAKCSQLKNYIITVHVGRLRMIATDYGHLTSGKLATYATILTEYTHAIFHNRRP
jgi:hypothetical protein